MTHPKVTLETLGSALAEAAEAAPEGVKTSFEQLLESPMDALMVVDREGRVELVNARLEAMFGFTRDELVGGGMERLLPERFRARHRGHFAHFFAAPHARPMGTGLELFAQGKDGREFPVEISLTPLTTAGGQVVVAAVRDVSERQEAARALHDAEQRLALHVRRTPLAVIEWGLTGGLISAWNPAAERVFGFRADEVLGLRRAETLVEDDTQLRAVLGGRGEAASARQTGRSRTKDGRVILCEWYTTLLIDGAGRATGGAALALDVTARQRAVEALLNAQDEERTRISRDLHDGVGQALTAIGLGLGAVLERPDPAGQRLQLVGVKELVAKTLEDVRRLSRDLRPALLDELGLEAAVKRLARELAERSGTEIDVLARLPTRLARGEETAVYRVVQEALTNVARHARAAHASVVLTASDERLHLIVEDDGDGFVPAESAVTTSVGLLGMRERVELLGGSLRLESTPGRGTIISARLPLQEQG